MDELLPQHHLSDSVAGQPVLHDTASALLDNAARLGRRVGHIFHKTDATLAGHRLGPVLFLAAALTAAATFVISTVYTPSYVVSVNGTQLGTVKNQQAFETVVDRVENRASDILGYDYTLDVTPDYSFALTEKSKLSSVSGFETYLFNQVGEVMKTHVLTIDGKFVGAAANESDLTAMLEELKAPFITENTVSAEFVGDVALTYEYTATAAEQDLSKMRTVLHGNSKEKTIYTVQKGDTYSEIAYNNDMSMDELMTLNPQADLNRLMIGDELTINGSVPFLSVKTVDAVTYDEDIACPIEERKDASLYQGDTKVIDPGVLGKATVSANIDRLNGVEQSRTVVSSTVLSEPTTRIVAVGTKARPKTMPKGYFIWPTYGRITSYFGYRSLFGSYNFHSGLDIAVPYGTAIAAADGGTVVCAGWKGSYGNLVIIDHGNGTRTYYGHNSTLLVSKGEKVYQGETIARAGSTGNSTGPHCHFEIQVNGTAVNPLSYLS
ncbi:MAG: peptidoglycan DD-metalloendopeptidase family protein [Oscillospiraceae bacterium]